MFKKKDNINNNQINENDNKVQYSKGLLIFCGVLLITIIVLSFVIAFAL